MKQPTLAQLDKIRKQGFRPGVVGCIIHNKKVLMFFKKEYKLWQLPQGGISNKESPMEAMERECLEELGKGFVSNLDFKNVKLIEVDMMEFKPGRHDVDKLFDDDGVEVPMTGKVYFFYVINSSSPDIDITKTFFDQHFWLSFREAYFLADRIYQKGKRRITLKIVNSLHDKNIIE